MRMALVSLQRGYEASRRGAFDEPAHLVGMHNRLEKSGIRSMVIDPSVITWKADIRRFSPDIVGITAPDWEHVPDTLHYFNELKRSGVPLIVGGVQATLTPERYAAIYEPDAIVLSQGEPVIDMFIKKGFDLQRASSHPFFKGDIDGTLVFRADKLMSLDQIDYTRPYSLEPYGVAWPTSVFGCAHQCVFCLPDRRIVFKSPDKFLQEIVDLAKDPGVDHFATMGPDFTANPAQSTRIIKKMLGHDELLDKYYEITVRVDSLAKTLANKERRGIWKKFCEKNIVDFQPGYESFLPERLVRFGKYKTIEAAKKQGQYLRDILDFMSGTRAFLCGTLIMVDPESTLEEIDRDLNELEDLTNLYPGKFLIYHGDVFSFLRSAPGTRLDRMYEPMQETYLMPVGKDPLWVVSLMLLNYYLLPAKKKAAEEYKKNVEGLGFDDALLMHQQTTVSQIKTLRFAIDSIRHFIDGARGKKLTHEDMLSFLHRLLEFQFPNS